MSVFLAVHEQAVVFRIHPVERHDSVHREIDILQQSVNDDVQICRHTSARCGIGDCKPEVVIVLVFQRQQSNSVDADVQNLCIFRLLISGYTSVTATAYG